MSAIYLLIAVSLIVAVGFLMAFLWSVRDGQYDDSVSPSVRILLEDGPKKENNSNSVK
jgi:cbb3-type cytochrome oxidase maturation protein